MDAVEHYIETYLRGEDHFMANVAPFFLSLALDETALKKDAFNFQTHIAPRNPRLRAGAAHYYFGAVAKRTDTFHSRIFVGRTEQCDIVIPDGRVSKLHAFFEVVDGQLCFADAGSRNGCRLNGDTLKALEHVPIGAGDRLEIGSLPFTVLNAKGLYQTIARLLDPAAAHVRSHDAHD